MLAKSPAGTSEFAVRERGGEKGEGEGEVEVEGEREAGWLEARTVGATSDGLAHWWR